MTARATVLDRRDALWFGAIAATAFALRWIFVHQLQAYPWFSAPQVDEEVHHQWAQAIARGESFTEPPFFRAPLYPYFLGLLYKLLGPDLYAVRIVQAGLGALSCGLVYLVGRLAFRRAIGVAAGFAAASYWVLLYFDSTLLIPVLSGFLHLCLLTLVLLARERRGWWLWALAGVAMGLAAIARPNVLLFAPALAAWCVFWSSSPRSTGRTGAAHNWRAGVALTLGTLAPVLPVTLYNTIAGDDFVLVSSQGGVNFFIGNRPGADGISVSQAGQANSWEPWYAEQRARAESAEGRPLKPSEISSWHAGQAWSFLFGSPAESLPLLARKTLYFVSHREIPNNQDPHFVAREYVPLTRFLPLGFWVLGPLGLLGLALVLRRRELFPLWGFVAIYALSVIAFFVTARFRVPVVPVLIILACHAVDRCIHWVRERDLRALAGAAAFLLASAWPVAQVPPQVDTTGILARRTMGLYLYGQGRTDEAREMLERVVDRAAAAGLAPDVQTWTALGQLRGAAGDSENARRAFEAALARDVAHAPARVGLATLAEQNGDFDDAGQQLLLALRHDARAAAPCAAFARRLAERGFSPAALGFLETALKARPGDGLLTAATAALRGSSPE